MKNLITPALLVVLVLLMVYVAFFKASPAYGSAVGTKFNSAKIAAVNISPATAAATSTSLLNTDDSGRWVQSGFAACTGTGTSLTYLTGAGLTGLKVQAATTSVSSEGLQGNVNYAMDLAIATSSSYTNNATSTAQIASTTANGSFTGGTNPLWTYWPSNSYLTFTFNATNTAACTVGVYYIPS